MILMTSFKLTSPRGRRLDRAFRRIPSVDLAYRPRQPNLSLVAKSSVNGQATRPLPNHQVFQRTNRPTRNPCPDTVQIQVRYYSTRTETIPSHFSMSQNPTIAITPSAFIVALQTNAT